MSEDGFATRTVATASAIDADLAPIAPRMAYQIQIPIASPLEGDPGSPECLALVRHLHRGPSYADGGRGE